MKGALKVSFKSQVVIFSEGEMYTQKAHKLLW